MEKKREVKQKSWKGFWKQSSGKTKLSLVVMGGGQFLYGAKGKGILFLLLEIGAIAYFVKRGFGDIMGFITLLAFKFMFSYGGPINQMIAGAGGSPIGFLDLDAKWSARLIGLLVNCWISTPSIMLLATGILSNRDMSLYEAARIDGASPMQQFRKLTLPFVLFSTTPVLIGQFVGNFNNFGIFYFLRGGLYMDGYFLASDTDLLINWLYNLSIDNNYYSIGAAISLVIFIITSIISLIVYVKSPSYREEDTFQ